MAPPAQERALGLVLSRCRTRDTVALEERKTAWERGHVAVNDYQQKAEVPDRKAACPAYAEGNAQVWQDGMLRVERTFQAFFRRVKNGAQPGYPRFQGYTRSTRFTYPQ
jgi:putative transposase